MYVKRNEDGKVVGWTRLESEHFTEEMDPNDQEILDFENPPETWEDLRKAAYPNIIEQMEMLYDKGVVGWKAEIKKIKEKYPKPDEGTE